MRKFLKTIRDSIKKSLKKIIPYNRQPRWQPHHEENERLDDSHGQSQRKVAPAFILPSKYYTFSEVDTRLIENALNGATIPPHILRLEGIKTFKLKDENLVGIFNAIIERNIPIEELRLGTNEITMLPKEIAKLDKLKSIYLDNNKITDAKAIIANLPESVETVYIRGNDLNDLKDLLHLLKYQDGPRVKLDICDFKDDSVHNHYGYFTALERVRAVEDNKSTELDLSGLYLDDEDLEHLLEKLPKDTKIETLLLKNNELKVYPQAELAKYPNLKKIDLRGNSFKTAVYQDKENPLRYQDRPRVFLPKYAFKLALGVEDAPEIHHHNSYLTALEMIEKAVENKEIELNFAGFQLNDKDFENLVDKISKTDLSITAINLSNNQLTKLPEKITELKDLEELQLGDNNGYESYPADQLNALPKLKVVYFNNTPKLKEAEREKLRKQDKTRVHFVRKKEPKATQNNTTSRARSLSAFTIPIEKHVHRIPETTPRNTITTANPRKRKSMQRP